MQSWASWKRDRLPSATGPHVSLWGGLVSNGAFINWQPGRPTHQDGSHFVESRIIACILPFAPSSCLPKHPWLGAREAFCKKHARLCPAAP